MTSTSYEQFEVLQRAAQEARAAMLASFRGPDEAEFRSAFEAYDAVCREAEGAWRRVLAGDPAEAFRYQQASQAALDAHQVFSGPPGIGLTFTTRLAIQQRYGGH